MYMMTDKTRDALRKESNVSRIDTLLQKAEFPGQTYPNWQGLTWSRDNFGPIYVPKAGDKIELNEKNYWMYKLPIEQYERAGKLEQNENQFTLNGQPISSYTFKMNYYFMMGDNRHNSEDSRYWGFVPEDHIVGKAMFVWLSLKYEVNRITKMDGTSIESRDFKGVRWNRFFMGIK